MSSILTEVIIILVLLVINGVFAMSEMAVIAAKKVRLEQRADDGDRGAKAALGLAAEPTQFLSTVQVGITSSACWPARSAEPRSRRSSRRASRSSPGSPRTPRGLRSPGDGRSAR